MLLTLVKVRTMECWNRILIYSLSALHSLGSLMKVWWDTPHSIQKCGSKICSWWNSPKIRQVTCLEDFWWQKSGEALRAGKMVKNVQLLIYMNIVVLQSWIKSAKFSCTWLPSKQAWILSLSRLDVALLSIKHHGVLPVRQDRDGLECRSFQPLCVPLLEMIRKVSSV